MKEMRKILKKATALLLAVVMAFTPIMVSAEESAEPFAVTTATAVATATQFMDALSIAGINMAVVDIDSGFSWVHGLGYADATNQVPVTEYTLFNIASTGKVFTAVAIMQLVEQGLLCLDEPIVTYLPNFSVLPHPMFGGDYRNITTRMLLTHTSGMHEFQGEGWASIGTGQDRYGMNTIMPQLEALHMQNAEMNRITYNNAGYVLLGVLVAAITGADNYFDGFVNFTQENIFDVLGMDGTSFEISDANRAYIAPPHDNAATLSEFFIYIGGTPAGGAVSNAVDMAVFMQSMLAGEEILSRETIAEMATVQTRDILFPTAAPTGMHMGLGLMELTLPSGMVKLGHGGNLQHHAELILDFDNGIGVFVSTNSATGAAAVGQIGEIIWAAAVYEKTGEALPMTGSLGTPFVTSNLQDLVGRYAMAGELVLTDDGTLVFPAIMGVPMPVELTPVGDGTFDSILGNLMFVEVEGIMFVVSPAITGERIELVAGNAIERWVGEYDFVDATGNLLATVTIEVDENGFAFFNQAGSAFVMNSADDYTFYFPGRTRMFGEVITFSMVDDVAFMRVSGQEPIARAAIEADAPSQALEPSYLPRLVIGSDVISVMGEQYSMEHAPFLCLEYGRTMIALYDLAGIFTEQANWNAEEGIATIPLDNGSIVITEGYSLPNGMGMLHIVDGNVFVPLAYVAYNLGLQVEWDGAAQVVYVRF